MALIDHKDRRPLFRQVKGRLVDELRSRNLKPNQRFHTFREIAEQHEVSTITASKAVSELAEEGILYCRHGKGTFVLDIEKIKSDSKKETLNIGVTFLDMYNVSSPYLSEVIKTVSEGCNRFGFNLQIFAIHPPGFGNRHNEVLMRNITKKHVDGLLIASRMDVEDIVMLRENQVPFVWINNDFPYQTLHCVLADQVYGVHLAIEHLIKLGHKRISMIDTSQDKFEAATYRVCLERAGLEFDAHLLKQQKEEADNRETGYRLGRELLNLRERPTAAFLTDDIVALGVMEAAFEQGLRVPDDLAIVGYGNHAVYSRVPLTTVDIHIAEMSRLSLEILVKVIRGEKIYNPKTLVRPELVIRRSCGAVVAAKGGAIRKAGLC